jgi:hypothetical protein
LGQLNIIRFCGRPAKANTEPVAAGLHLQAGDRAGPNEVNEQRRQFHQTVELLA